MTKPTPVKMTTEELILDLLTTKQCLSGGRPEAERLLGELKVKHLREAADAVDSGKERFTDDVRSGAAWSARMLRRMADETAGGGAS